MAVRVRKGVDGTAVYWAIYWGADYRQRLKKVRTVPPGASEKEHKLARAATEKYALEQRARIDNGEWKDPIADKPLRQLINLFLAKYRPRSGRIKYYKSRAEVWLRFLGDKPART